MTAYIMARLTITDADAYGRYLAKFRDVLAPHGGQIKVVADGPDVLWGSEEHQRIALIEFADEAAARRWWSSAEYRAIAPDREAGTDGTVLLLPGVPAG